MHQRRLKLMTYIGEAIKRNYKTIYFRDKLKSKDKERSNKKKLQGVA